MKYGILYNCLNSAYILQSKSLILSITKTWYPGTILLEIRIAPASTAIKENSKFLLPSKSDNTSVIKHWMIFINHDLKLRSVDIFKYL